MRESREGRKFLIIKTRLAPCGMVHFQSTGSR